MGSTLPPLLKTPEVSSHHSISSESKVLSSNVDPHVDEAFRCKALSPLPVCTSRVWRLYELKRQVICPFTNLRCCYGDKMDTHSKGGAREGMRGTRQSLIHSNSEIPSWAHLAKSLIRTQYYSPEKQYFSRAFGFILWILSSALWTIFPFPKN